MRGLYQMIDVDCSPAPWPGRATNPAAANNAFQHHQMATCSRLAHVWPRLRDFFEMETRRSGAGEEFPKPWPGRVPLWNRMVTETRAETLQAWMKNRHWGYLDNGA